MTEENRNEIEKTDNFKGKKKKWPIIVLVLLIISIALFSYWWMYLRNRVTTDDAYVKADSVMISTRIPGTVKTLLVDNDNFVKKGQLILTLDSADYDVAAQGRKATLKRVESQIEELEVALKLTRKQTRAQVLSARAGYQAALAHLQQSKSQLDQLIKLRHAAEADYETAKKDLDRYKNLFNEGAIGGQKKDHAENIFLKAKAKLNAIKAQIASAKALIVAAQKDSQRARAMVKLAKANLMQVDVQKKKLKALNALKSETEAALKAALLNQSYCKVYAPISGFISQKRVEVGEKVMAGQPLMAVVPLHRVYIEANYKETQLEYIRIGQKVEIHADIYPDYTFHGHVASIRAGTGAAFSLLPPENATGNWIKVVQRVPVKIQLDTPPSEKYPLRVGLSVQVTIDTSNTGGTTLSRKH